MRKLYPGECREYAASGVLRRSWHVHERTKATRFYAKIYRAKLIESVERSLPSVRQTGLFLSGGMDSASVLWAMHQLGRVPETMSMRFEAAGTKQALLDGDCDAAKALAKLYGAKHTEILFSERDYMEQLTEAFSCDEPISRKGMPAYLFANKKAKEAGWVVCFTGDGGDELLSGYGKHLRLLNPEYEESQRKEPYDTWVHMQSQGGHEDAWRHDEAAKLHVANYMRSWLPDTLLGVDRLRNELQLEGITHLAEDFLLRADKLGMSQGLETRFPLLSEPFRSYALGLPSSIKTKGRVLKACAREAMKGYLPDYIINKPKSGWGPPTGNWLAGKDQLVGPLGDRIKETVVPGRVPAIDKLLDVTKVRSRIKATLSLFYLMTWAETTGLEDS
jgi:asparagine synthase (glutamine-hydrolysing)